MCYSILCFVVLASQQSYGFFLFVCFFNLVILFCGPSMLYFVSFEKVLKSGLLEMWDLTLFSLPWCVEAVVIPLQFYYMFIFSHLKKLSPQVFPFPPLLSNPNLVCVVLKHRFMGKHFLLHSQVYICSQLHGECGLIQTVTWSAVVICYDTQLLGICYATRETQTWISPRKTPSKWYKNMIWHYVLLSLFMMVFLRILACYEHD